MRFIFRYHEGRKVLKNFAKATKTELSDDYLDKFEAEMRQDQSAAEDAENSKKQFSILDLFGHRKMGFVAINIGIAFMFRLL